MLAGRFYSGWAVLTGSFICAALTIGFTSYIYGMFTVPVTEELGISRSTFNNGMIGLIIGGMIASPVIGKLLDLVSPRLIVTLCGLAFGTTLMLLSRLDTLWLMMLLVTLPLSFSTAGCGVLGANTVVVRWFRKRRGRALGILSLSTSVGGFIAQPLTAFLIESFGWRDALFLIGLVPMLIFWLMAALVIRAKPDDTTPGYDKEFIEAGEKTDASDISQQERAWSNKELLFSRNFWLTALGIGMLFGIDQAVLLSQVPYFQDVGFDLKTVSLLVAVKAISAIGGKLLVGYLADKIDLRLMFAFVAGCNALLLGVYILQPSFWFLLLAVATLGIAVGGVFPAWSTILAWLFGARSYGSVMGMMAIIMQPFAMLTMRFIGQVYDQTGTYVPAFVAFIAMDVIAIILIALVRPDSGKNDETMLDTQTLAMSR